MAKTKLKFDMPVADIRFTFNAVVAVVAVRAFPFKEPVKPPVAVIKLHVNVEVDGLYVSGVVVLSTYSPVLLTPLLNKIGYDPEVSSVPINTLVALVAVPEKDPEKFGHDNTEVLGL